MKPSERILKSDVSLQDFVPSYTKTVDRKYNSKLWHEWVQSILDYLDEEYEKQNTFKQQKTDLEIYEAVNSEKETRPFLLKLITEKKNIKIRVLPQLSKEIRNWCFNDHPRWNKFASIIFGETITPDSFNEPFIHLILRNYDGKHMIYEVVYGNNFCLDNPYKFIEYDVLNDCEMKK